MMFISKPLHHVSFPGEPTSPETPQPLSRQRYSLTSSRPHRRPRGFASQETPAPGSARSAAPAGPVPRGQRPRSAAPPQADGPGPRPPPPAPSGSCVAYREGSAIYIYSSGLFLSDWHFEEQPGRAGGVWGGWGGGRYMAAHRGTSASHRSLRERGRGEGIRSGESRKKTRRSGRR